MTSGETPTDLPDCCKTGYIHSGTPVGTVSTLHEVQVYSSLPKEASGKRKAVLILSDVFGWEMPNTRLIADKFADSGFHAFLPDFFYGSAIPYKGMEAMMDNQNPSTFGAKLLLGAQVLKSIPSGLPFILRYGMVQNLPQIKAFATALRNDDKFDSVVVIGYCWGGRPSVLLTHDPALVDAAATVHPGGLRVPSEISTISKPVLFLHTIGDPHFAYRGLAEETMVKRKEADPKGTPFFEFVDYKQLHGFAIRGDLKDPKVKEAQEEAFKRCVDFFNKQIDLQAGL
ncbi:hypothetical protein PhCBS80983_g02124 [Powellomyces hirtus]|uniref:Dienelactone hydrolase domain-containing protein n=1 Tax=Powellomyces hirtus TaxID=109895 RepID=A0A507E7R4_9FUNG|nr:hypothetical protein PhCBS80983_g02124 [Powellomyces hirtus]